MEHTNYHWNQTKEHFSTLRDIAKEEGIGRALKYDVKSTLEDVNEVKKSASQGLIVGGGLAIALPAAAGIIAYNLTRREIWKAGNKREKERKELGDNVSLRQKFNDSVRNMGNKLTPRAKRDTHYGLGDFVTQDVKFRKAGTILGVAAPSTGLYFLFETLNPGTSMVGDYIVTSIPNGIMSLVTAGLGYSVGAHIDALTGDKKAKKIVEEERERRARVLPMNNGVSLENGSA